MSSNNLTNLTTTIDYSDSVPNPSVGDDRLKTTLAYAIPFSCLAVVLVLIVIIGVRQRNRLMNKWNCLRRMKNTNPKFYATTGIRRDSEFDSYSGDNVQRSSDKGEDSQGYRLATVF